MITRVDTEIGRLMQLLKELNLDNNTLVIFASNNGNTNGITKEGKIPTKLFFADDYPRAGMKGDILDGAFHVPAIPRWPERIAPGQESDHIWESQLATDRIMWQFFEDLIPVSFTN